MKEDPVPGQASLLKTENPPAPGWVLLRGSDAFFPALIEGIDAARTEIGLETYIFDFSCGAIAVAEALERAANRGVQVRVMLDGFGTPEVPMVWRKRWRQAGVQWLCYSPLIAFVRGWPANWRRLHRKLCVIDQVCGFCGGVNLLDDHWDPHTRQTLEHARLDFSLQVWGPVVEDIHRTMLALWTHVALKEAWKTSAQASLYPQGLGVWSKSHALALAKDSPVKALSPKPSETRVHNDMRLVIRDNLSHRWQIQASYLDSIRHARQEIWIANAYFFPSSRLLKALCAAAKRGVRVHVLLAGRPEYAWAYRATWHLYGVLIKSGVQVHEYTHSFLHAKVALVDDEWSTVGSSNLDPLSLMMAREANIVTRSKDLAQELKAHLQEAIATGSAEVHRTDIEGRSRYNRARDMMAYGSVLLALKLARMHY
jgi:cardiolipin synthase